LEGKTGGRESQRPGVVEHIWAVFSRKGALKKVHEEGEPHRRQINLSKQLA